MKNKSNDSVLNAIENIITSSKGRSPLKPGLEGLHPSNKPTVIISDSDSTFLSKQFQKLLEQNNIIHNTVPIGDHHSLGVIDRFALTLKRILSKQREITKSPNWFNSLEKVISVYNNTEHSALNNLTPNEASQKKYKDAIVKLNIDKFKVNKIKSDKAKINKEVRGTVKTHTHNYMHFDIKINC